jgi:hypothetical protein
MEATDWDYMADKAAVVLNTKAGEAMAMIVDRVRNRVLT